MKKVLLIDDEEMIIETTSEMLEILGFEVQSAYNGNDGLIKLDAYQPDFLILDCHLPDITPEEIISSILKKHSNIKIIISSGVRINDFGNDEMNQAIYGFLNKPFDLNTLEKILKE